MFTRAVFSALRDVAASLSHDPDTSLRYSESTLELVFRLPRLEKRQLVPRWLQAAFGLLVLVVGGLIAHPTLFGRCILVVFGLVWFASTFGAAPALPFVGRPSPAVVRVFYATAEPVFSFELVGFAVDTAPALPLGSALPAAAISAVCVLRLPHHDSEQLPFGLVEVQTTGQPYRLFAMLPSEAAAQQLARALRLIVGLPAEPPQPWWRRINSQGLLVRPSRAYHLPDPL